jgi:hypothetical protein
MRLLRFRDGLVEGGEDFGVGVRVVEALNPRANHGPQHAVRDGAIVHRRVLAIDRASSASLAAVA